MTFSEDLADLLEQEAAEREEPFPPDRASQLMEDLLTVGPAKPMGYLPLHTIHRCGYNVASVYARLEADGLFVFVAYGRFIPSLYAADLEALQALLAPYTDLLSASSWPTSPADFVRKVAEKTIKYKDNPDLHVLIGRAFNDKRFRPDAPKCDFVLAGQGLCGGLILRPNGRYCPEHIGRYRRSLQG